MLLRLLILTGLLALVPAIRAGAQVSPSPDDARRTLEVLQDPQKRDQLLTTLRTIAQTPPPAATPEPAAVPIAPDSLGAEVLMGASGLLNHISDEVIAGFGAIRSAAAVVLAAGDGDGTRSRNVLLDSVWRRRWCWRSARGQWAARRTAAPDPGSGPLRPLRTRSEEWRRSAPKAARPKHPWPSRLGLTLLQPDAGVWPLRP